MSEMTKEEAIALYKTNWWENASARDIVGFQLFEPRLCTPMDVFKKSLNEAFGRPVYTHELGTNNIDNLKREYLIGPSEAPSFEDIMNLIPEGKRIMIQPPDPSKKQ